MRSICRMAALFVAAMVGLAAAARPARAQNDWQFPDPYFGAFQHRGAGTPQAEKRYRQEISPQQPIRLHEHRASASYRRRWSRHRGVWHGPPAASQEPPRPTRPPAERPSSAPRSPNS